jgi:hypothetical protein
VIRHQLHWTVFALVVACLSGCYTTRITRGDTAQKIKAAGGDERWHSGFVFGIAEVSGPHDLQTACPNGWAEIETETSFLNGLVQFFTWGWIYNPQTVSIACRRAPPVAAVPSPVSSEP